MADHRCTRATCADLVVENIVSFVRAKELTKTELLLALTTEGGLSEKATRLRSVVEPEKLPELTV